MQGKKTAGETRRGNEERKGEGEGAEGRTGRRMTQRREEKEECMFVSHLQWRRTA